MIRVILFDDSKNMRRSVELYFRASAEIFLAASFANANDAVKCVREYKPDVILMDIQMPGTWGLEALRQIRAIFPTAKILMLTSFDDDDKIFDALCNGASGYALKGDDPVELQQAIVNVYKGQGFLSPTLAGKVIRLMQSPVAQAQSTYEALTDRQREVLRCMVEGLSRKMIAEKLDIGIDTVGDHTKEIYRKLHVNSAPEAVREAIQKKIIT